MKVIVKFSGDKVDFLVSEVNKKNGIGQGGAEVSLVAEKFSFWLPEALSLNKKPHNDLIAFSVIAALLPWLEGDELNLQFAVSEQFAKQAQKLCNVRIRKVSKTLRPRKIGNIPGIAFSGGYDSTAAALVMPEESKKITFIREDHPDIPRREDNTQETVIKTVSRFDDVTMVKSNLEYIAGPYLQFPTWISLAIPCVLLADKLDLKGIAFGSITGSSLVKNGGKYEEKREPDKQWVQLLNACSLDMYKPVAGLTEISTAKIVHKNSLQDYAVSCTIGTYKQPCNACKKCFRKYFINCAVKEEELDPKILNDMISSKAVQDYILTEAPIYFQHIFMYPLLHYGNKIDQSGFELVKLFKKKLLLNHNWDLNWIIRHDFHALDNYIKNDDVRTKVRESVERVIDPVNQSDYSLLVNWDLYKFYKDNKKEYNLVQKMLKRQLEKLETENGDGKSTRIIKKAKSFIYKGATRIKRMVS